MAYFASKDETKEERHSELNVTEEDNVEQIWICRGL